jgi:hypothetical protein
VTVPAAPAGIPVPDASHVPDGGGQPQGDGAEGASTEVWHSLFRLPRPPKRRAAGQVLIVALLVAAICWYFGADASHSILIGTALALGFVGLDGPAGLDLSNTDWRGGVRVNREGARRDITDLSWSLRGRYGRVSDTAVSRVRQIARQRLALHQLDLIDPADHRKIEQLIGRSTCALLVWDERRPPSLRSLLHCLDVLDALDPTRATAPPSRPRHQTPIFALQRSRRARER